MLTPKLKFLNSNDEWWCGPQWETCMPSTVFIIPGSVNVDTVNLITATNAKIENNAPSLPTIIMTLSLTDGQGAIIAIYLL